MFNLFENGEFVTLSSIEEEVEWLRNLLIDVPIMTKVVSPITIYYDNQSVLLKAYNENYNGKSKTIRLKYNHMKDLITNGIIAIQYVKSSENRPDPLSKGLRKELTYDTSKEMGLLSL